MPSDGVMAFDEGQTFDSDIDQVVMMLTQKRATAA